jgi:hypothetical protein
MQSHIGWHCLRIQVPAQKAQANKDDKELQKALSQAVNKLKSLKASVSTMKAKAEIQ